MKQEQPTRDVFIALITALKVHTSYYEYRRDIVILGMKHVRYHSCGFQGGQFGKDDPNLACMSLEEAISFLI